MSIVSYFEYQEIFIALTLVYLLIKYFYVEISIISKRI